MNATVKINQNLLRQESAATKIIKYLQDNPSALRQTNATILSNRMGLAMRGVNTNTIRFAFSKLVKDGVVNRVSGNKRHGNYRINYLSNRMPQFLIDRMPAEDKERYKREVEHKMALTAPTPQEAKQAEQKVEVVEDEPTEETREVNLKLDGTGKTVSITFNIVVN